MGDIGRGLVQAVHLIVSLDPGTYEALGTSLRVTLSALLWSALVGFPLGILLAFAHFRGKQGIMNVMYTFMGFPPVVAGLLVYLLLSRSGPLGPLELLYTPTAMIIAQILLALPVIIGLTVLGLRSADKGVVDLALTLGATRRQASFALVRDARLAILGAVITAFGNAMSEVGAAMLVGGNIEGATRTLTTALMLETRQGSFDRAIALGIILLLVSFLVNVLLSRLGESTSETGNVRHID
ncbi:MAG: ABC transporter permease [Candidatus Cryosericum sp.]|nr:ABC transporter permease [bacterium]